MFMTLKQWSENQWLRPHMTSRREIDDLLRIVDRDLADTGADVSADWRFGIAYNAALKLCTALLYASGYRPHRTEAHYRTLQSLALVLGSQRQPDADYLETCRRKRNVIEYERVGEVTYEEADEFVAFVEQLRRDAVGWLRRHHPELLED